MSEGRSGDFVGFAIREEAAAAALYEKYAGVVESRTSRELLRQMAAMERDHEAKLRKLRAEGRSVAARVEDSEDLRISDFMVDSPVGPRSDPQEVFIFAMKAEEKAFALYSRLSELESDPGCIELFLALASEERQHKRDLEFEYERAYMTEN